jgi:hypothetical protein
MRKLGVAPDTMKTLKHLNAELKWLETKKSSGWR